MEMKRIHHRISQIMCVSKFLFLSSPMMICILYNNEYVQDCDGGPHQQNDNKDGSVPKYVLVDDEHIDPPQQQNDNNELSQLRDDTLVCKYIFS